MMVPRASWVVTVAVIAVVAGARPLREQVREAKTAQVLYQGLASRRLGQWRHDPVEEYRPRATAYVQRRYPSDPEMLMAAGLLAPEAEEGLPLLSRAVQLSHDPVCYAAYVGRLIEQGPEYARIGSVVLDPADREEMARAQERRARATAPDRLSGDEVAPILRALRGWERADPDNGVPHALEAHYLYGLHRDEEAKQAWERAGRLPQARAYAWAATLARARLLSSMGMVKADAVVLSAAGQEGPLFEALRHAARYAWYEGRVAQLQGQAEEAMRWWSSTISLGRRLQECADTKGAFMDGFRLEEVGAIPAWQLFGQPWYGPAHAFYAAQVGPKADAELRNRIQTGWARVDLLQQTPGQGPWEPDSPITRATGMQGMAGITLKLAIWCLVLFALVSLAARRTAETAARPGWAWPAVTALLVVVLALAGPAWALLHPLLTGAAARGPSASAADVPGGPLLTQASIVVALLSALCVLLLLSLRTRESKRGLDAVAFGASLRRVLPVVVAALALACLALNVGAARLRAEWLAIWTKPGTTRLSVEISRIGPKWDRPPLREKPWVAAELPERGPHQSAWPF